VPWLLVTEKDIPNTLTNNINWLYSSQRDDLEVDIAQERVDLYAHHFIKKPQKTIIDIAKQLDVAYSLPPGQSLSEIRQLLANRYFLFDIFKPYGTIKGAELTLGNIQAMTEALHVSNQ